MEKIKFKKIKLPKKNLVKNDSIIDSIIDPIIDKKIKYDLNYIKKNIDLNKFIKYLQNDLLWDDYKPQLNIIGCAIRSCLHDKNKDPNIINYKKKFNNSFNALEDFLVLNLFSGQKEHFNKAMDIVFEEIKIPKNFNKTSDNFYKKYSGYSEIAEYPIDGSLLEKIHPNFKKIFHFEFVGEQGKGVSDSHSFYHSKYGSTNNYLYVTKTGDYNQVVKFYKELNEEEFVIEIIQFKLRRGFKGKEFFIDKKTGENIIDKFKLWDYCKK